MAVQRVERMQDDRFNNAQMQKKMQKLQKKKKAIKKDNFQKKSTCEIPMLHFFILKKAFGVGT